MSRGAPIPLNLGSRFSVVTDDAIFPLSSSVLTSIKEGTIPETDAAHLDAPQEVIRNVYYKKIRGYFHGDLGALRDSVASRATSNGDVLPNDPEDDDLLVFDSPATSDDIPAVADNVSDNDDDDDDDVGPALIEDGVPLEVHIPALPPSVLAAPRAPGFSRIWDGEETWSNITPGDIAYSVGFTDVVFNGMYKDNNIAVGPASIVPGKPVLERLQFDRNKTQGSSFELGHPIINLEESRARESLAAASEQRVVFAGCSQVPRATDGRNYCCGALPRAHINESPATQRAHVESAKHGKIECPRNSSVYSVMGNLDLNRPVFDSDHHYIHVFLARPMTNEHHQYISDALRTSHHTLPLPRMANFHIPEWEFGIMTSDSGLQMSMDQQRRKLLFIFPHPGLSESTRFALEKQGLVFFDIVGPPLPNVSQLYAFGDYRNTMIDWNEWQDDNDVPLNNLCRIVGDPGMLVNRKKKNEKKIR